MEIIYLIWRITIALMWYLISDNLYQMLQSAFFFSICKINVCFKPSFLPSPLSQTSNAHDAEEKPIIMIMLHQFLDEKGGRKIKE